MNSLELSVIVFGLFGSISASAWMHMCCEYEGGLTSGSGRLSIDGTTITTSPLLPTQSFCSMWLTYWVGIELLLVAKTCFEEREREREKEEREEVWEGRKWEIISHDRSVSGWMVWEKRNPITSWSRAFSCDFPSRNSRDALAVAPAAAAVEAAALRMTWRWASLVLMIVYQLKLA